MSDTSVPVRTGQTAPVAPPTGVKPGSMVEEPRKLDDVMMAMDVVDTLRHRTRIVDMELNESAREEQLVARLKEIYGAQGIEVPDRILKDGVKALALAAMATDTPNVRATAPTNNAPTADDKPTKTSE